MKKHTYTKFRNKISRIVNKTVYHNYAYKPDGIYYSSKEYIASLPEPKPAYVEVYPDLVTQLHIPIELYTLHVKHTLQLSVKTTYLVTEIPNGRVYSDNDCSVAVISADNKLIHDVSFTYSETNTVDPATNNIFRRKYFVKPKIFKGTVFCMTFGGICRTNSGHWLTDILPRIHLLRKSGLFDKVDYFLVPSLKQDFQRETLQLMGIPLEKVIDGEDHPHITADTLIASTAPCGFADIIPYWSINFLRESLIKQDFNAAQYPSRIYISRKDTSIRNVVNEEQVMELLGQYGFVSYQLSKLSVVEKVRLFASADVIVAPTGAGLVNLYFCKPSAKVIEIFSKKFVIGPSFDITSKLGLDYHYIISDTIGPRSGFYEHIRVDTRELQKMVEKVLAEKQILQRT